MCILIGFLPILIWKEMKPCEGSGVIQGYQKLEYAISYWLGKPTEHVLGCVLSNVDCFSLYRGRALMDDNVMKTFTNLPSAPQHYIQYDQAGAHYNT